MKRCTLSRRGVVSGWPRNICTEPPNSEMAVTRKRQTCTTRWLGSMVAGVGMSISWSAGGLDSAAGACHSVHALHAGFATEHRMALLLPLHARPLEHRHRGHVARV